MIEIKSEYILTDDILSTEDLTENTASDVGISDQEDEQNVVEQQETNGK